MAAKLQNPAPEEKVSEEKVSEEKAAEVAKPDPRIVELEAHVNALEARSASLQETIDGLELDLAEAKAARKAPIVPEPTERLHQIKLGIIAGEKGVFAIADTGVIDATWVTATGTAAGWYLDISGDHAEWLAKRQGTYKVLNQPDGSWRIVMPDAQIGNVIRDEMMSVASAQGWDDTRAVLRAIGASATKVLDATRDGIEHGVFAGVIGEHLGAIRTSTGPSVKPGKMELWADVVEYLDGSKRLTQYRLVPIRA